MVALRLRRCRTEDGERGAGWDEKNFDARNPGACADLSMDNPLAAHVMKPRNVRLFVKPGCGWCDEAREGLRLRGVTFTELDVTANGAAWEEMKHLSGQTRAPTLDVDGQILADFGAQELDVWWIKMGFEDVSYASAVPPPPMVPP